MSGVTKVYTTGEIDGTPLGGWIAKHRVKCRLTTAELAQAVACTTVRISDIERGWNTPTPEQAAAIDAALGTGGRVASAARKAAERAEILEWAAKRPRVLATLEALLAEQRCGNCVREVSRQRALMDEPRCAVCVPEVEP